MGKLVDINKTRKNKKKKKWIMDFVLFVTIIYIIYAIYLIVKTPSDTVRVENRCVNSRGKCNWVYN